MFLIRFLFKSHSKTFLLIRFVSKLNQSLVKKSFPMLQEERKRMLRLETSTFITRFRHLKGPKGHRTFLVLTLQHGNSVGCNFTQSPFMQWNHRKSRYKNLWEFQENSQLLSSVAISCQTAAFICIKNCVTWDFFITIFFPPCCLDPAAASSNQVKVIGILAKLCT